MKASAVLGQHQVLQGAKIVFKHYILAFFDIGNQNFESLRMYMKAPAPSFARSELLKRCLIKPMGLM